MQPRALRRPQLTAAMARGTVHTAPTQAPAPAPAFEQATVMATVTATATVSGLSLRDSGLLATRQVHHACYPQASNHAMRPPQRLSSTKS